MVSLSCGMYMRICNENKFIEIAIKYCLVYTALYYPKTPLLQNPTAKKKIKTTDHKKKNNTKLYYNMLLRSYLQLHITFQ